MHTVFLTWLYYQGLDHYAWCMCNIFTAKTNCGCFSPRVVTPVAVKLWL